MTRKVDTIIDKIKQYKLKEIKSDRLKKSIGDLEQEAKSADPVRDFHKSLLNASKIGYGLIGEIKKASPSKGLIRKNFDPSKIATQYKSGGANCLSVLTDQPSFKGSKDYLRIVRKSTTLPILRKDFFYDPYQVVESRALGADCILIILASVSDVQAEELEHTAFSWGMNAILEVHNEQELERAKKLSSKLIGVNNRDLKTFKTTLDTTRQLAKKIPKDRITISESGLKNSKDLANLATFGVRCFLIGESIMREKDVTAATRSFIRMQHKG